jgi:hypothetical protein
VKRIVSKIWDWIRKNLGVINVLVAFCLLVLGFLQFGLSRRQFDLTLEGSSELSERFGRLDTTLSNVEKSASSLDTTITYLDTTLGIFREEMRFTLNYLEEYTNKSYNRLMISENLQKEVLQSLETRQEIIQREIERMPLIILVANDARFDSVVSLNFRVSNFGDKSTEDIAIFIRFDDKYKEKYKVVKATGASYVLPDSQKFWIYFKGPIYRGGSGQSYNVAGDQRIVLQPKNGIVDDTIKLIAVIYTPERDAYDHSFLVERTNSGFWFRNAYIIEELNKILARQSNK